MSTSLTKRINQSHFDEAVSDVANFVDVEISSAELLALNATPQTILKAPGANKAIVPLGAMFFLDYNSAAYAGIAAGEDLSFKYTNAAGAEVLQVEATGFLDQASDQLRYAQPSTSLLTPVANAAIVLHMLVGEITTGNSPLRVRFYYRVVKTNL